MKRWIVFLTLGSLVLAGALVVYLEAFTSTPFCWECEEYCNSCNGIYSVDVDTCWWIPPWQYCRVHCQNCKPSCSCGTTICIMDPPI